MFFFHQFPQIKPNFYICIVHVHAKDYLDDVQTIL